METLQAELARAKEQARSSNAAALKAAEELRAERAAHCESKEKMAKMAVKLKDIADHCQFLEEENRAKATDLMASPDNLVSSAHSASRSVNGSGRSGTLNCDQNSLSTSRYV